MRVAVLAVHPPVVASTRLRVMQHDPCLAASGVAVQLWSFFRPQDLPTWFGSSQLARAGAVLLALLRLPRLIGVLRSTDVVLVQREALPLGPPWVELLAARGRVLVWDVDDAVWERFTSPTAGRVPAWLRAPGGKYQRLCARADEVWAGSEVLAQWCSQHSDHVEVVPTVVPVPLERPKPAPTRTVGWIGSHSTGEFIEAVLPALRGVEPPPAVVIVGATPRLPDGLDVTLRPWSAEAETQALEQMRVGLYPIDRAHALAEGKCGLKAVLYMSRGIPPVVTGTTTNAAVVRDGVEGLHAETPGDWTAAVQRLLDDDELHERLSRAAHARARASYSLDVWGPRIAARLHALAAP